MMWSNKRAPAPPPPLPAPQNTGTTYSIDATYRLPGFWKGCIATREALRPQAQSSFILDPAQVQHHLSIDRLESLAAATDPLTIPEFEAWRADPRGPTLVGFDR